MTIHEQKEKAKELLRSEKFEQALPLFQMIWETEKNEWNGYYLAQCLRKLENYGEAAELEIGL
jgi:thioredoxin-like negative regulator of GroEL